MAANSNQMNKYNQPAFMFDIAQLVKLLLLIAQYNLLFTNTKYNSFNDASMEDELEIYFNV